MEVQPYAFTTKSLYVGHMDYRYLRWQVIDTPGLLDRPLEDRNTIEMQVNDESRGLCFGIVTHDAGCSTSTNCFVYCVYSVHCCAYSLHPSLPITPFSPHTTQSITALAHLRAAVLYIVDISEQCGYTIAQQAALFDSVKPLFSNKPLLIVANKVDVTPLESLKAEDQATLRSMVNEALKVSHGGAVNSLVNSLSPVRSSAVDTMMPSMTLVALLSSVVCCAMWCILV